MHDGSVKKIIITNNPMVFENNLGHNIIYDGELSFAGVLKLVRDNIHIGRRLLTHPLSGSVKPYETPYKTVLVTEEKGSLDIESLEIIESGIQTAEKFSKISRKQPDEKSLKDFQLIDFDLVREYII